MVVRTECKGLKVTGIYIGARNVRGNFPRHLGAIEFELGHLRIDCQLSPGFWQDQPRICDSRLCQWLEFELYRERKYIAPLPLVLVQSGRSTYKVRPLILPAASLIGIGDGKGGGLLRQHNAKAQGTGRKLHPLPAHPAMAY
jgi:hypothetical protein